MDLSFETSSAAAGPAPAPGIAAGAGDGARLLERLRASALGRIAPELWALLVLAGVLDLWELSRNRWANVYYSAAVRSMAASWHDFLYVSLDRGGVMTVDKPPLALWVQALSVRMFGYHPLSVLLPDALIGMATVVLVYDLVRRRFGRVGGFAAGLALALTPITVAISRHNNPDALLVLCCVAALWFAERGLERGRTRWIVLSGVAVGLAFETKMLVALVVVPGIAAAWLWVAPAARGRLHALRQLLLGGAAMIAVGGAWPLLVELTPAGSRPWISGTSDNRILSLIFEYNGVGRVDGQAGGPGGGGGITFGGATGPLRLLNSALGGQGGWLLGFAVVAACALALASRLRAAERRSGWLIAVGGSFLVTAVLFSFASGIFHPYYVSLLAPFTAALVGAGVAQLVSGGIPVRIAGPAAIGAGAVVELVVRSDYPGELGWLVPVLIVAALLCSLALVLARTARLRAVAVAAALVALLAAPAAWSFDTLGYATSSTFPAGGPQSASARAPGGAGGPGVRSRAFGGAGRGPGGSRLFAGPSLFGGPAGAGAAGQPLGGGGSGSGSGSGSGGLPGFAAGGGPFGAGAGSLTSALSYVSSHGGGTLAVASQSTAAQAIIEGDDAVAGIGGFSGRESAVSARWLAEEVRKGKIRWVLDEQGSGSSGTGGFPFGSLFGRAGRSEGASGAPVFGGGAVGGGAGGVGVFGGGRGGFGAFGPGGEERPGARPVMRAVEQACTKVQLPEGAASVGTLYDCAGRAAALERV